MIVDPVRKSNGSPPPAAGALPLLFLLAAVGAARGSTVTKLLELALPEPVAGSQDVRWETDQSVVLSAGTAGVFRLDLENASRSPQVLIPGGTGEGRAWFSTRVAASERWLLAAAPVYSVVWTAREGGELQGTADFDVILDVDVDGDHAALLAAKRTTRLAPDGAVGWIGSLSKNLTDARPVYYSTDGPGASSFNRCGRFSVGAIRYMRDGTLIIVPGFENGIYKTDRTGRVLQVWDSTLLTPGPPCHITEDEASMLGRSPAGLDTYVNGRVIVEDALPLRGGAGLVVRYPGGDQVRWRLIRLTDKGPDGGTWLPIGETSASARVKADVRGDRLVLLVEEPGPPARPRQGTPRLLVFRLEE